MCDFIFCCYQYCEAVNGKVFENVFSLLPIFVGMFLKTKQNKLAFFPLLSGSRSSFTFLFIFQEVRVCVLERLLCSGRRITLFIQPRNLLPPSSEKYGKSEVVAYFRKALEKVGQLTSSSFSLLSETPSGIKLSQSKRMSLKIFNSNFLILNL